MMNPESSGKGPGNGEPVHKLTDAELQDRLRLTNTDAQVLDAIISEGKRGSLARLKALEFKARFGHAVPKGRAVKAEPPRPTVYVLEVPAGGPAPRFTLDQAGQLVRDSEGVAVEPVVSDSKDKA